MKAFGDPTELVESVDEAKKHIVPRVIFWRRRWEEFSPPPGIEWKWQSVPFAKRSAKKVPDKEHGLYTFVLCPKVAAHPKNHLVLYVGKAERTSLRKRFQHYLQEMKKVKRAHVCYALNKYNSYLEFCFITVQNQEDIGPGEDALLTALMPPYNEQFPASVNQIISGLR